MAQRLVFSSITEAQWQRAHERFGSVYFILDADNDRMKIGHSRDPWKRLKQLQTGSSARLSLVAVIAGSDAVEKRMHSDMREHNVHREWFSDASECITWLHRQTKSNLMCRMLARLVPAREVQVLWEWNAEHRTHFMHVYDHRLGQWVGPLMFGGRANARPGWDATTTELAPL